METTETTESVTPMAKYPERPTCHDQDAYAARFGPAKWEDGAPYWPGIRTCSYCGSIHPEDLVKAIEAGETSLSGADWKGWPHKFYLANGGVCNKYPTKWYNDHLKDEGYDEATLARLIALIEEHAGIGFKVVAVTDGTRLQYRAPCANYQSPGLPCTELPSRPYVAPVPPAPYNPAADALKALGSMPGGYCFCYENRDPTKPDAEHTGECLAARDALAVLGRE